MVEQYIKNNLQREKRLCCTRTPDGTLATGENWSQNNLWCPNDPRGQGIDDDDDDDDDDDHPTKFGCRKISSSADMVETVKSD